MARRSIGVPIRKETEAPAYLVLPTIRSLQFSLEVYIRMLTHLPLKDAVRTSALSRAWRDLWRLRRPDDSMEVEFKPCNSQVKQIEEMGEQLKRLPSRRGRHLERFSLVFHDAVDLFSGGLLRSFLECAAKCTVEVLRVDVRSLSALNDLNLKFNFPLSSLLLASLTLCRVIIPNSDFGGSQSFSSLAAIHLHTVTISDEVLHGMVKLCPGLRILELLYCCHLTEITIAQPGLKRNLRRLTVAGCSNVRSVVVVPDSPLPSFHYSGGSLSPFHLSCDSSLTDLYFCCYRTPALSHQVFEEWFRNTLPLLSNVTVLTICSNTLQIVSSLRDAGANAEVANLQSLRELQLLMFELTAPDLGNIFVFLKSCQRPNLRKLVVQLPTNSASPEDFLGLLQEEQPELGLDNLEVVKIMNFNWHHIGLKLLMFFLRKARYIRTLLLVSAKRFTIDNLDLQGEDLFLIGEAVLNGKLVISGFDYIPELGVHAFHSEVYAWRFSL